MLVIGNPPYTRHQGMDPTSKAIAREAAGPLVCSRLAGMAAYFLAATLRYLRPSDALCMILPGSWMHARYGREIREHLWGLTHRSIRLDVFPHDVDVFPRARVDAVVLFVGPEAQEPKCLTVAAASIGDRSVTTAQAEHNRPANSSSHRRFPDRRGTGTVRGSMQRNSGNPSLSIEELLLGGMRSSSSRTRKWPNTGSLYRC